MKRLSLSEKLEGPATSSPTPHPESHIALEVYALKHGLVTRPFDIVCAFTIGMDPGDAEGRPVLVRTCSEHQPFIEAWIKENRPDWIGYDWSCFHLKVIGNLYGRRTAAATYRDELEEVIVGKLGHRGYAFTRGVKDACLYKCKKTGIMIFHHVDDGKVVGTPEQCQALLDTELSQWLELKKTDVQLPGTKVEILKKTSLRLEDAYITLSNPKHAEGIIAALALEKAKDSSVPGQNLIVSEDSIELLSKAEADTYSHCVGLAIYLGEERRDCRFSIKELARRMTDPRKCDMANLRILGRHLKGTPRMARVT